jgi:hypothetical protein
MFQGGGKFHPLDLVPSSRAGASPALLLCPRHVGYKRLPAALEWKTLRVLETIASPFAEDTLFGAQEG